MSRFRPGSQELEDVEGVRVLMQGGVNPDLPLSWYTDLIHYLREHHPSIALDCFSPIEIEGIADVCGLSTLEVLTELKECWNAWPSRWWCRDACRRCPSGYISKKGGSAENWLRVMHEAQSLDLTTSATNVFGFGSLSCIAFNIWTGSENCRSST